MTAPAVTVVTPREANPRDRRAHAEPERSATSVIVTLCLWACAIRAAQLGRTTAAATWFPEESREGAAARVELHALVLEQIALPAGVLGVCALRDLS